MDNLLTAIIPITALAVLYVVTPVVLDAYRRYRGARVVSCPESRMAASIRLDPLLVAASAAVGTPKLRVKTCSRWPEHAGCAQECVAEV